MKYWIPFLSLLLWLGPRNTYAQAPEDSVRELRVRKDFTPSVLRVGVSLNDLIRTLSNGQETRYSAQADLALDRYMLVVDYGQSEIALDDPTQSNGSPYSFSSQGWFFRAGVDVNLLKDRVRDNYLADENVILFGLRFARAQIDETISFETEDSVWGTGRIDQTNSGLGIVWAEMTAGMKVSIFRNVYLGYNLRFKFFRNLGDETALVPYQVPGYGRGNRETIFGFDYYLFYRIPFRRR